MFREFICGGCPNRCKIRAEIENGVVLSAGGAACPGGRRDIQKRLREEQKDQIPKETAHND